MSLPITAHRHVPIPRNLLNVNHRVNKSASCRPSSSGVFQCYLYKFCIFNFVQFIESRTLSHAKLKFIIGLHTVRLVAKLQLG